LRQAEHCSLSKCTTHNFQRLPPKSNDCSSSREDFIRQALAPLPNFSNQYPVLGSWLIDHTPCGLSIREDENPITGNTSRFLPHAIL
jgi:glutathionylspermidine synthase